MITHNHNHSVRVILADGINQFPYFAIHIHYIVQVRRGWVRLVFSINCLVVFPVPLPVKKIGRMWHVKMSINKPWPVLYFVRCLLYKVEEAVIIIKMLQVIITAEKIKRETGNQ